MSIVLWYTIKNEENLFTSVEIINKQKVTLIYITLLSMTQGSSK